MPARSGTAPDRTRPATECAAPSASIWCQPTPNSANGREDTFIGAISGRTTHHWTKATSRCFGRRAANVRRGSIAIAKQDDDGIRNTTLPDALTSAMGRKRRCPRAAASCWQQRNAASWAPMFEEFLHRPDEGVHELPEHAAGDRLHRTIL